MKLLSRSSPICPQISPCPASTLPQITHDIPLNSPSPILPAFMGYLEPAVLCTGPQLIGVSSTEAHSCGEAFRLLVRGFTVMDQKICHSKFWTELDCHWEHGCVD